MNDVCACGHVRDEHNEANYLAPCTVEDCDCDVFDWADPDDDAGRE